MYCSFLQIKRTAACSHLFKALQNKSIIYLYLLHLHRFLVNHIRKSFTVETSRASLYPAVKAMSLYVGA